MSLKRQLRPGLLSTISTIANRSVAVSIRSVTRFPILVDTRSRIGYLSSSRPRHDRPERRGDGGFASGAGRVSKPGHR